MTQSLKVVKVAAARDAQDSEPGGRRSAKVAEPQTPRTQSPRVVENAAARPPTKMPQGCLAARAPETPRTQSLEVVEVIAKVAEGAKVAAASQGSRCPGLRAQRSQRSRRSWPRRPPGVRAPKVAAARAPDGHCRTQSPEVAAPRAPRCPGGGGGSGMLT